MLKSLQGVLRNPKRAILFWVVIYILISVISIAIMKILEVDLIIPDDDSPTHIFSTNSDAFADSMSFRWIIGLPFWILFGRNYFLRFKFKQAIEIKAEAFYLTILWVFLTIFADSIIWVLIPAILRYNAISFIMDSWPWLILRYALIYFSIELGRIPALRIVEKKRY
jgi:hypothetical protein